MNTILFGFQLGIGLILAYIMFCLMAQIYMSIITKILIYRLKKTMQTSKPANLNYGKNEGVR